MLKLHAIFVFRKSQASVVLPVLCRARPAETASPSEEI